MGRPTVYQFQVQPVDSENARPVHAEEAKQAKGGDSESSQRKVAETLSWKNNTINITVETVGAGGSQSQTPTQEVKPETDLNLSPGN